MFNSVSESATDTGHISDPVKTQSVGIEEISTSMQELDRVTQKNAAMFEETTAARHGLTRKSNALRSSTMRFTVAGVTETAVPAATGSVPPSDVAGFRRRDQKIAVGQDFRTAPAEDPAGADDWTDF